MGVPYPYGYDDVYGPPGSDGVNADGIPLSAFGYPHEAPDARLYDPDFFPGSVWDLAPPAQFSWHDADDTRGTPGFWTPDTSGDKLVHVESFARELVSSGFFNIAASAVSLTPAGAAGAFAVKAVGAIVNRQAAKPETGERAFHQLPLSVIEQFTRSKQLAYGRALSAFVRSVNDGRTRLSGSQRLRLGRIVRGFLANLNQPR